MSRPALPTACYLVLASQAVSLVGSDMQQIALPLWVHRETGSTIATGVAFAIQFVPIVLLAPWVGYLADRFDRRRLMIWCELGAAAVVAVTLAGVRADLLPLVFVCSALTRAFNAVTMPAMQAIIIATVAPESRVRSASLSTTMIAAVQITAPLAGTAIAGTAGIELVLVLDIASFLLSALLLAALPPCPGVPTLAHAARSTWLAFRDHASPLLRRALGTEAVFFLLWGADAALALLILEGEFGAARAGLFATAAGTGWVLASALIPVRLKTSPAHLLAAGAMCGPVAAVGFVALVHYGPVAAFVPGVLVGVGNLAVVMGATIIFQQEATTEVAGRLFAVRRAVLNSMLTLSYLLLPGVSAAGLGHRATLVVFSVLMFVTVFPMARWTARRAGAEDRVLARD